MNARVLSTAEERRETLVESAVRVFAERGFHGTPTAPSASSTVRTAACNDASSVTSSASVRQPAAFRSSTDSRRRAVA